MAVMTSADGERADDEQLVVHYSVSFNDPARSAGISKQLDISLTTLRATNPDLGVVVFCHGPAPDAVRALCARHEAELAPQPDPVARLREEMGELGAVVGSFGPVHKFLNFGELTTRSPRDTLYLDADTVVFGDLTTLIPTTPDAMLAAREEVGSGRCRYGADPGYLDEQQLATSAAGSGMTPTPAFNTGVVMFHRFPWHCGDRLERRYLAWLTRFATWMVDHPADPRLPQYADVFDLVALRRLLSGPTADRLRELAVPFPSVNRWLVEEAAAWVAFGAEPSVRFGHLDDDDVAQGGEPLEGPLPGIVWHYFSGNQDGMERRLGLRACVP